MSTKNLLLLAILSLGILVACSQPEVAVEAEPTAAINVAETLDTEGQKGYNRISIFNHTKRRNVTWQYQKVLHTGQA